MDGILLIDKPSGWTSFDVVAKIRGMIKKETGLKKPKVGHTGTLDPLATGLMVVVVGSYCKRAEEFSKQDKTYEVTMRLGMTSVSGDEEGEKRVVNNTRPTITEIEAALRQYTGTIMQTPPIFSAIKVNGQRAYKLAREGKEVALEPREVAICRNQLTDYSYPDVQFTSTVSSGTYIRSLTEDLGKTLNTGAYMAGLRRTKVGLFDIADALQVEGLDGRIIVDNLMKLPDVRP